MLDTYTPRYPRTTDVMTRAHAIALAVASLYLAVAACGDDETGSAADVGSGDVGDLSGEALVDATTPPEGFDPDAATYQPTTGVWIYRRGSVEENTCGDYAWADRDTPFRIAWSEGGTFVIEQGEPWGNFACFVLGTDFVCPRRGSGEEPIDGTDVVIRYVVRIEGELSSDDAISGTQHAEVTCTGLGCGLAPSVLGISFPCGWQLPFTAERAL